MSRLTAVLFGMLAIACRSGLPAEHPLTVPLGLERTAADGALKHHQYCVKVDGPRPEIETYSRCPRAGFEWGESWVMATYKENKLVELRRYERIADANRATERWNQLIADRAAAGGEATDEATTAIRTRQLEPGTKTVKAFRVDANTVVGVYLLTPAPPEEANILEAVLMIPKG